MVFDSETVDKLTAIYESQSPSAFVAFAMEGLPKDDYDHNQRYDSEADADHSGDSKCDYCCCNDRGCCSTAGWYAGLVVGIVVLVACCCYATNGFNGVWTYWPF